MAPKNGKSRDASRTGSPIGLSEQNQVINEVEIVADKEETHEAETKLEFVSWQKVPAGSKKAASETPFDPGFIENFITKFQGYVLRNKFQGEGTCWFISGAKYTGEWEDGNISGHGIYMWPDGSVYKGTFKNGVVSGEGIILWSDGCTYKGSVSRGCRNGKGEYFDSLMSSWYKGGWLNGLRHGQGRCDYSKTGCDYYEGEWRLDKMNGVGIRKYPSGDLYYGDWVNGVREGKGLYFYKGGLSTNDVYIGSWSQDLPNGLGEYVWQKQSVLQNKYPLSNFYRGQFKDGVRHGVGMYVYADGSVFKGEWRDNLKNGHGKYVSRSGHEVEGTWLDDVLQDCHGNLFRSLKDAMLNAPYKVNLTGPLKVHCLENIAIQQAILQNLELLVKWYRCYANVKPPVERREAVGKTGTQVKSEGVNKSPVSSELDIKAAGPANAEPIGTPYPSKQTRQEANIKVEGPINLQFTIQPSESLMHSYIVDTTVYPKIIDHIYYPTELDREPISRQYSSDLLEDDSAVTQGMCLQREVRISIEKNDHASKVWNRLKFWQFLRDIKLDRTFSCCSISSHIASLFPQHHSDVHNPFDDVLFWKYLQMLVAIAVKLYPPQLVRIVPPVGVVPDTSSSTEGFAQVDLRKMEVSDHAGYDEGWRKKRETMSVPGQRKLILSDIISDSVLMIASGTGETNCHYETFLTANPMFLYKTVQHNHHQLKSKRNKLFKFLSLKFINVTRIHYLILSYHRLKCER